MYLQLQSKSRFLDLHLTSGLHDWDMNEEIKLTTTTDQFYHDDKRTDQYLAQWHYARISRRSLPAEAHRSFLLPLSARALSTMSRTTTPVLEQSVRPVILPDETCLNESVHDTSLSSEYQFTDEDDASSVDVPVCRKVKGARKGKTPKASTRKLGLTQNRRLQRALQDSINLKNGGWPRPPVNYCILIAMALSSSRNGSLNVQQIYNFTREHFPFFLTAPDGWKNTIRHNLCFSNSFKKTPQQVSGDGKRKSCLWHLTLDGRQRLRDEIHTLTGDSFRMLKRSMNYPDMIQALLEL
ncbi:forkhead box protein R1 isoform X2 [Chanodichthys erythropterus]|uniref:forkhead box protein R1 isoform X2 n=1 Tax=Chanodichthys erythropterus TaxID=933992 RepID=UPI00351DB4F5